MNLDDIDFSRWKTFDRTGWEKADAHAESLGRVSRRVAEVLVDLAGVTAGSHVLDIATGPGYAAAAAGARGARVVGIDCSERLIERAWWKYPGIEFRKERAEHLPFSDIVFDIAMCNSGMARLSDPIASLSEAHRVLVSGGTLAFTSWRTDETGTGFGIVFDALKKCGAVKSQSLQSPHTRYSNRLEIEKILGGLGFQRIEFAPIRLSWRTQSVDELLPAVIAETIYGSSVLSDLTNDRLAQVRDEIRRASEAFKTADGYRIPMPAVAATAKKP